MRISIITLLSFSSFFLLGQAPNPKRSVLFTMLPGERIYSNEYFLAQSSSAKGFSCVLIDQTKHNITFVFNGVRIKSMSLEGVDYSDNILAFQG